MRLDRRPKRLLPNRNFWLLDLGSNQGPTDADVRYRNRGLIERERRSLRRRADTHDQSSRRPTRHSFDVSQNTPPHSQRHTSKPACKQKAVVGSGIGVMFRLPVSVKVTNAAGNPNALPSVIPLEVPLPV